ASAFSPTFVHSLDVTHMMLTALECCMYQGLTFLSVHGSYRMHASTIDKCHKPFQTPSSCCILSIVLERLATEVCIARPPQSQY
ncbi:hypothetical protein EDB19DRAFT_1645582, partial [Suillus lakei]